MVLVEFAMFPTDKGASVSQYVSQIIDIIDKSGIEYQLTPMSTIVEGEWDDVMALISKCFKHLEPLADRIYSTIKVDYRKTSDMRMKAKVNKIQAILDREIKHS